MPVTNPFTDIIPPVKTPSQELKKLVNGTSLNIGNGDTSFKADRSGAWLGAKKFADAPFKVDMEGNTRVNVLTNKSILFETITDPDPNDGQLWCADNLPNQKVLWGYFGGDTTNKQQISTSRMQTSYILNNATSSTSINIPSWFQPRLVTFHGFFSKPADDIYGISQGQAGSVSTLNGECNAFYLDLSIATNIVKDISISTSASLLSCDGLSCYTIPYVSGYTNTSFGVIDNLKVSVIPDCIGASSADLEAYLYVSAWNNTSVTVDVVIGGGWNFSGVIVVTG